MALNVTSQTGSNHQPGVESRGQAIARVVAERDAKLREASNPAPAGNEAPSSNGQANAAPEPKAAEPKANEPDPRMLVEIERRERALDQAKREAEDLRRELESAKAGQGDLKDWRKALELGGHKIEDVVQEWLGGEPAAKEAPKTPEAPKADTELLRRLERLEQKEQEELRGRAKLERRQQIAALIPQDSEDFELTRHLGDHALDTFLAQLENHEKGRPGGIGPSEISLLLKEFEGNTRKNIESQVSQLAKSKWAKQIMRKLLESSDSESATGPEIKAPREDSAPANPGHTVTERNYTPSGITREQLISRARAAIVSRMR